MPLQSLQRDISYALRQMRRTPVVAAAIIASAAIGIAANTTVFSAVKATLLGALSVPEPERLVSIYSGPALKTVSYPLYSQMRDSGVFENLSATFPLVPASLNDGSEPERLWGQLVTANYFATTRTPLALGRGFNADEEKTRVVVLSHSLWVRRFKSDRSVVGRQVNINRDLYTVAGVAERGFHGTIRGLLSEFWVPLGLYAEILPGEGRHSDRMTSVNHSWLLATGRLKPGVTRGQAAAALTAVDKRTRAARGLDPQGGDPLYLETAGGIPVGLKQAGIMLGILGAVSGMVLLIACANVANLLLARALARRREMSVRLAIGASRQHLIRQLLTESVVLAVLGAAGGLLLTWWATRALQTLKLPIPIPLGLDFTPDLRVLGFAVALSVVTGIFFGLAPALKGTRQLSTGLKEDTAAFGSLRRWSMSHVLVAGQVTLTTLLLVGCGLFMRSLAKSASVDLGFDASNVTMASFDPHVHGYSAERIGSLMGDIQRRVAGFAGVESVSFADSIPLSIAASSRGADGSDGRRSTVGLHSVSRGFFDTMRIRLLAGADFPEAVPKGRHPVILNTEASRRLFGNEAAVGATVRMGDTAYEVVGIVATTKDRLISESPAPLLYEPLAQTSDDAGAFTGLTVLVRASRSSDEIARELQRTVRELDPNLAVFNVSTMDEQVKRALLLPRVAATLFGMFAATGLVLSVVGLFGLMSYAVRRRTREIGIRLALGAEPRGVLRMISMQGLAITAVGLIVGGALSFAASSVLSSFLFGVDARDIATFVAMPLAFLGIALLAILVPAWRASKVSPLSALRYE